MQVFANVKLAQPLMIPDMQTNQPPPSTPQPNWSLRDELQTINQRWPIILLLILIGSLVGWFIARLLPGPYQATTQLYVGLNPYRAIRDMNIPIHPESVNDYKNWQMEDLKTVLLSQPILDQTLARLRKEDPYWETQDTAKLVEMLKVYWRNAGTWNLVAEHSQKKFARQAVKAWEAVVLPTIRKATAQSQQVFELDTQLQALATEQASLTSRQAQLEKAQADFATWVAGLKGISGSVSEEVLNQGLAILQAAELHSGWDALLSSFPGNPERSKPVSPAESTQWAETALSGLKAEVENIQAQSSAITAQQTALGEQYANASKTSLGLSANLVVDRLSNDAPEVKQLRSTGTLILVGALFGLIAWIGWWLIRISRLPRT